jgi:hypothetical protein
VQHAKRLQGNAADQVRKLATLQRQAAQLAEAAKEQEQQLMRCAGKALHCLLILPACMLTTWV